MTHTDKISHPESGILRRADDCDVMLLLEGTFPYVSGGVSSWVNQIMRGFPEIRFGAVFIGSRQEDYREQKYALPDNLVHLEVHFLHEQQSVPPVVAQRGDAQAFEKIGALHNEFQAARNNGNTSHLLSGALQEVLPMLEKGGALDQSAFLYSETAWKYICDMYRKFCSDPSFVDYFWTVRSMHAPIWTLSKIAASVIPARCYHSISTGYAGFLGALLQHRTGRPLLLSEHGIYTKERKIDLFQSEWIQDNRGVFEKDASQMSYFRDMWIRFFEALGRMCYEASSDIVALYETNRLRQVSDGAIAERTRNIPNGIDWPRLSQLVAIRSPEPPPILCLIGRVVPIKDVKTFIRAMRTVVNHLPEAEGWIAGPEDEDPDYANECRNIVEGLGLKDKVKFLGFQKIDALLPQLGLVVLSSISEALPLVVLEGFAAGVPVVATDVGACSQLVFGLDEDDQALGAAGDIVGIADPQALAHAAISLLSDTTRWHAAQAAGLARAERYYTQIRMFDSYRELYQKLIAQADVAGSKAPVCPVEH